MAARKKSLAASLFLFTGASVATLFSIPATATVLSNVPSVSSSCTVEFVALALDGEISGGVFVLLSSPPQCISGQAVELFVIFIAGQVLLALISCAYATATAALARQTVIAFSIASVTINASVLTCTLPITFIVFLRYGAGAFAAVFPVPISFATVLVGASADLRKKIKAI